MRGRILRKHRSRRGILVGKARNLAHFKTCAAQFQRRYALIHAHRVGNVDLLRSQALRHAHMPLATHHRARSGRLRHDVTGSYIARIVAVVDVQIQSQAGGFAQSVGHRHALQRRHLHFGAVNRKLHGRNGGQQCHGHEKQQQRSHLKEVRDGAGIHEFGSRAQNWAAELGRKPSRKP